MYHSTFAPPSQTTQRRELPDQTQAKTAAGSDFSARFERQAAEVTSSEAAADAVKEALESAETAEVFSAKMLLGDGGEEGESERQKREAMQKRRKIALAALDAMPVVDAKLSPPSSRQLHLPATQPPTITEAMLQRIVSDVHFAVHNPTQAVFQVQLKEGALKGLQFRIVQRPEGVQVIFLSDSTEIRSLLRMHADRLTKSLRDRQIVVRTIDIRDPEEDERERRHQRRRDAEQEMEAQDEE